MASNMATKASCKIVSRRIVIRKLSNVSPEVNLIMNIPGRRDMM